MEKKKKILLIISGGIAAYKTLDLIRTLVSQKFEVKTILSKTAEEFVTPLSIASLSKNKVYHNKFDLIVSNPPYIMKKDIKNLQEDIKKFEPKLALDGGNDGLDVIKKVIYKSKSILKIKGMLALEIGNEQYKKVSKILRSNKFKTKYLIKDYRENIRCILSTLEN